MSAVQPPLAAAPDLQPGDFLAALQALLPRGRAWTRDPDAVLTGVLNGIAVVWAAGHANERGLLWGAFPSTAEPDGLLPDWEASLGLPDPCLSQPASTLARQAAVVARLTMSGGQSIAYYEALAVSLGGSITVTEYAPFRWGIDTWGEGLRDASWAYCWLVTLNSPALYEFSWGISCWGEPFWQAANQPIACEILRYKPGHTTVEFAFAPGVLTGDWFVTDLSPTDSFAVLI